MIMKESDDEFLNAVINSSTVNRNANISALSLAYMGDAVFEILVRTKVLEQGDAPVKTLHKRSEGFVKAESQSKMYRELEKVITEKELQVMKRGRNAKSFSKAKNATISDYKHATGVEALFGYLFLTGETERLKYLFEVCINNMNVLGEK